MRFQACLLVGAADTMDINTRYTGVSPSMPGLSRPLKRMHQPGTAFRTLQLACRQEIRGWAFPTSLAATTGISVDFFSSPY